MQIHFVVSADAARVIDPGNFDVAVVDKEVADAEELIAELQKMLPVITISPLVQRLAGRLSLAKPIKHSQLCAAMQEASRRRELQIATTSLSPASRRDLSILLAEDNAVNQKVALLMLKRLGYRADVAANGLEVLQALKQQPYDVILMDIQMPEMDGLQAARIIRQMPLDKQPQILAMTAYVLQGDKERCLAAGMDGYLGKPVQIEELSRALENIGAGRKE
jgi:CheY-like chemotaxis protein